jgi:uncharacterized protein
MIESMKVAAGIIFWPVLLLGSQVTADDLQRQFTERLNATVLKTEIPDTARLAYADGKIARERGDFVTAAAQFTISCEGGVETACVALAWHYQNGRGVEKNEARSLQLYRDACNAGNAFGCSSLGYAYEKGDIVKQDFALALLWSQKGCDGGHDLGCLSIARAYQEGMGVPSICGRGVAPACLSLGVSFSIGRGVQKDHAKAAPSLQKSCDLGAALGCSILALQYELGKGVPKDAKIAAEYFQKALEIDPNQPSAMNAKRRLKF